MEKEHVMPPGGWAKVKLGDLSFIQSLVVHASPASPTM